MHLKSFSFNDPKLDSSSESILKSVSEIFLVGDDRSSEFRVYVVVLMVFSDGVGTIVSVCVDRSVKLLQ